MRKSSKHLTAFVLACAMMTQAAPIAPALAADAEGYTPVVTTDKQYTGYENGNAALDLTQIGRYNSGVMNPDGNQYSWYENGEAKGIAAARCVGKTAENSGNRRWCDGQRNPEQ